MATAVPMKGSSGRFVADKMLEFIEEVGDKGKSIIVKTDQEPAIQTLVQDMVDLREEGRTLVEEAPKQSKGSNGVVERKGGTRDRGANAGIVVGGGT